MYYTIYVISAVFEPCQVTYITQKTMYVLNDLLRSYWFSSTVTQLSYGVLFKCQKLFIFLICAAIHQEVVFDRQDEDVLCISSACIYTCACVFCECVLSIPCDCLAFWQVCDSQICQQRQHDESLHNMLAVYSVSPTDRQTRKDDQMVHCIFLTRRWTQQPGFITNTNKSMNEWITTDSDWLGDKRSLISSTINRCQYFLKLLNDVFSLLGVKISCK